MLSYGSASEEEGSDAGSEDVFEPLRSRGLDAQADFLARRLAEARLAAGVAQPSTVAGAQGEAGTGSGCEGGAGGGAAQSGEGAGPQQEQAQRAEQERARERERALQEHWQSAQNSFPEDVGDLLCCWECDRCLYSPLKLLRWVHMGT